MVWEATLQPIGTGQSSSTAGPPPAPPAIRTDSLQSVRGGHGTCGLVGFNCDPFSAADTIVVASGNIGVKVTTVAPQIGLINGTYVNEGSASVAVCATRAGMSACGAPIADVTFGLTLCTGSGATPIFTCPHGQIHCGDGCRPASDPECHPK